MTAKILDGGSRELTNVSVNANVSYDALRTVKAFQVTNDNYESALERLAERYDNKVLIFQDLIAELFDIQKITKPSAAPLRQIVDNVSAILDSLSHLGKDKDITHAIIIHLVLSKVDNASKAKWDEQLNYKTLSSWSDCASVLIRRCQFLEVNDDRSSKPEVAFKSQKPKQFHNERRHTQASLTCTQEPLDKCLYCSDRTHALGNNCQSFQDLNVAQRFDYVKKNAICINCLKRGHSVSKCRSSRCRVCQKPHNTLLHQYKTQVYPSTSAAASNCVSVRQYSGPAQSFSSPQVPQFVDNNSLHQNAQSMHASGNQDQIILATAVVQIKNKFGEYQLARTLLDSGSQVNFMTEDLAQKLLLKREDKSLNIVGIGEANTKVRQKLRAFVKSRTSDFEFSTDFYVMRSISDYQPDRTLSKELLQIPENLDLADPNFNKPQKVDMLIGAESFFELLSVGQIKLGPSMPTLQKTLLGWIVSGKYKANQKTRSQVCNLIAQREEEELIPLHALVQRFWELEEVPSCSKLTDEHQMCESHFSQNIQRMSNGRFEVRLPFKSDPKSLGFSYETAKRRFLALERRVSKNPDLQEMYTSFMKEYLALGHMSPTNDVVPNLPHYFIPHQCVIRPQSTSTKLRVVFDASSKSSTQRSLNDLLMVGPTIQADLFSTLLRFRLNKFAITADIKKMYRQVNIHEADRNFQLILWRETPTQPIHIFRLNTVTYGTSPAPFLAIRCLKEISDQFKNTHPVGAEVIANDFYVDDLLSGSDSFESLEKIRQEVVEILSSCGFDLAKWYSNHENYDNDDFEKSLDFNDSDATKALGIMWKPKEDCFKFNLEDNFSNLVATKRNILSASSRLFDPLGLLGPIVIKAKILLQELWIKKLDWDESVPQYLDFAWQTFKRTLSQIDSIVIPRFVNTTKNAKCQIHGFADASQRAYGCCLYIRSEQTDGSITTRLLTAKSKVAPINGRSVPDLELCAAHLLAKLWQTVQPMLKFDIESVTFWSDSEIVLHWIKTHPSALTTFVGNRIGMIQQWSEAATWRHVPTRHNPADIISRGCDVDELINSIWFCGPSFLAKNATEWPKNEHIDLPLEKRNLGKKKTQFALLAACEKSENLILSMIEKLSSYQKVVRIVAYVYRFIKRSQKREPNESLPLSVEDLNFAFLKIIEIVQKTEFADEIKSLKNSSLPKSNLQKLGPFLQNYEVEGRSVSLLRVGGRLFNAPLKYDAKFPLLLPKKSHFVILYLTHLHLTNCHAGPKILIGLLRQKIWLVNARQTARKVVNSCILCFKFKPKLKSQIMGNLPQDRFSGSRPFYVCGVDLFGPIYTSLRVRGRPPVKTYVAVFVCFTTKAVHLEPLSDLTTDTFLSTLSRFVGRRGLPKRIWCDNATNFAGAARQLDDQLLDEKEKLRVQQLTAEQGIEFRFIPPRAPHFGGLWEAAVKSAKHLLLRSVAHASPSLTFEELATVLVDVEAILNSRPLAPMSEDPNDGEALTPGHLLIGCSLKALPGASSTKGRLSCLKQYRRLSCLKARFWSAWLTDYVLEQQQRAKWSSPSENVAVGTVVLIHEDNLPPQKWLLGRIISVAVGQDGKVRVAEIKTATGTLKRPIHKLAPLPISCPLTDSQPALDGQPCNVAGVS